MLQRIINHLFGGDPVDQYTTALHAGDVDTCINCIRGGNENQKKKMQEQWNLFYTPIK